MKKVLYAFMIALTGLFFACSQEHIEAVYDPAQVIAQTLGNLQGCELAEDGADIQLNFTPAFFGDGLLSNYTLYIDTLESMKNGVKLSATFDEAKGTATVSQKGLNSALLNFGVAAGVECKVYFQIESSLKNDKNASVSGTSTWSNIISASFIPFDSEILDVDKYPHVWVIGASASIGAWSFEKVHQYLYDYNGGGVYTGLIDFGTDGPSGGFKLTGAGEWRDDVNWGSANQDEEPETPVIQLVAGGGSKDIKCYSHRYYFLSFKESTLELTAATAFDNVGIVGSFNEWSAADANMKMTYNEYYHRFYIDMTFAADAELKFTCDDDWALNWGVNCEPGGANIPVTAGSYRIYLDLNNRTYDFNARMFGQEEPGGQEVPEPTPVTYEGWGIIGVGGNWETDIAMTEQDGVWTGYATIAAADQFKLRKDAGWDDNRGAEGDVEPCVLTLGAATPVVNNGKNLSVPEDGFYKVVYSTADETVTVSQTVIWGVIGGFNEWSGDVFMTESEGIWTSPAIELKGGDGFKIRQNGGWDVNRGATGETEPYQVELGTAFEVVNNGKNLCVEADGKYFVFYDANAETMTVTKAMPDNTWSLIGVNGDWGNDIFMDEVMPGVWVSPATTMGGEFKLRYNHDWGTNRGCDPLELGGGAQLASQDGPNIQIADGTYIVVYDANMDIIFLQGWSLIGTLNGANWDIDYPVIPFDTGEGDTIAWISYPFYTEENSEFKFRFNATWDIDRGGDFTEFCVPFPVVEGGNNIKIGQAGYYYAVYNPDTQEAAVAHADWGIIGDFNSWGGDVVMYEMLPGVYMPLTSVFLEAGKGFKIRKDRDWSVNRGATGDIEPFVAEPMTEIPVVNNGKNLTVAADGYYMISYDSNRETVKVMMDEPMAE